MFRIFFTNFGYHSSNESPDLEGAVKIARKAGFQSQITDPQGATVATYCPVSGVRTWRQNDSRP